MSIRSLALGIGLATSAAIAATSLQANEFFWPAHRDSIDFKVKAHGIRGTVGFAAGETITIGDKQYQEVLVSLSPAGLAHQPQKMYIRADDNGLYSRYSTSPQDNEVIDLLLPAEAGKSWQTVDQLGNPSTRTIEAITDCDLKGMAFDGCVRVSFESPGGAAVAFFAPGYGEIVNSRKNGFLRRTIKSQ